MIYCSVYFLKIQQRQVFPETMSQLPRINHSHQCHQLISKRDTETRWQPVLWITQSNWDIVVSIVFFISLFLVLPIWLMPWIFFLWDYNNRLPK